MIADVWTVIWKEWKMIRPQRGGVRGGMIGLLIVIGIPGIFLPLQMGRLWVESPIAIVLVYVSLIMVTNVTADSFAGERERHTLETLLASRLSDRAILFGKVGADAGYGWGLTLSGMFVGLVTVNFAYGRGELLLYPPVVGLGIVVLSLLAAGLASGAGILISLRASTVLQAQQKMTIALFLLLFIPSFGAGALPAEWKARLAEMLSTDLTKIVLIAAAILIVLDIGLLCAAMARFKRTRLILD